MTETFLLVRLGEGEVYRNVVWKLQKCHDGVGGDDVKTTNRSRFVLEMLMFE